MELFPQNKKKIKKIAPPPENKFFDPAKKYVYDASIRIGQEFQCILCAGFFGHNSQGIFILD